MQEVAEGNCFFCWKAVSRTYDDVILVYLQANLGTEEFKKSRYNSVDPERVLTLVHIGPPRRRLPAKMTGDKKCVENNKKFKNFF